MRETRMIVVSDLFDTEFVLCITNLDNVQLQTMLSQFETDMENGDPRPFSDIVENYVDNESFEIGCYIKELGGSCDSDFEDVIDLDLDFLCQCDAHQISVVHSRKELNQGYGSSFFLYTNNSQVIKIFSKNY